jgi:hypothetical protein
MAIEKRRYNDQELREVLQRVQRVAKETHPGAHDGLSAKELVETAQELGYSEQEATTALVQYEEDQRMTRAESELRQIGYRRLSGHFIAWTVVNAGLLIGGVWAGHPAWLIVLMGLWTTAILVQLRGALFPHPDGLRASAKKRLVDQAYNHSKQQFTTSVKAGTAKLLSLSAAKIDEKLDKFSDKR